MDKGVIIWERNNPTLSAKHFVKSRKKNSSKDQNLLKSLSDLRKMKTKKEARLLTKADSASRLRRDSTIAGSLATIKNKLQ